MENKGFTIDSVALGLLDRLKKAYALVEAQIGLQPICVLGNHGTHKKEMEEIANKLCKSDYPATIIVKIPEHNLLSDFQKEIEILNAAAILTILDSPIGGVVSESTYLIQNPELMKKSVLMVPDNTSDSNLFSTKNHYVYYPTKIKYSIQNLVEIAVMVAKQASHRIALNSIFDNQSKSNKN